MQNNTPKEDQCLANLKLEGLSLSSEQYRIVERYKSGKISKEELIKEAFAYAKKCR
jgi:hypothetical protein